MHISLREWLIIIGIIIIAGILIDSWRRVRGKNQLKLRLDPHLTERMGDDSATELLGPARVVSPPQTSEPQQATGTERPSALPPQQRDLLTETTTFQTLTEPKPAPIAVAAKSRRPKKSAEPIQKAISSIPEEVLVINVVSHDPQGFSGPALLQNVLESGLRFGKMNIFHRHESLAGNGKVLFSMANAVQPGTFHLDQLAQLRTPAVSFFLALPGPRHPKQAFDVMLAAARKLAAELGGELKDEQRSVMTAQTIEHYRSRILDFQRRHLAVTP